MFKTKYYQICLISILFCLLASCSFKPLINKDTDRILKTSKKRSERVVVVTENFENFVYIPSEIKKIINRGIDKFEQLKFKNIMPIAPTDYGPFFMYETSKVFFPRSFVHADLVDTDHEIINKRDYDIIIYVIPISIYNISRNIKKEVHIKLNISVVFTDNQDHIIKEYHYTSTGTSNMGALLASGDNYNDRFIDHQKNLYGRDWLAVSNYHSALSIAIENFFELLSYDLVSPQSKNRRKTGV